MKGFLSIHLRLLPALSITGLCVLPVSAELADPYILPRRALVENPTGDLTNPSGMPNWDAESARNCSGLASPKLSGGRIAGFLGSTSVRLAVDWPAPGADLDLGFNDFLDLELQLPKGFDGRLTLEYSAERALNGGKSDVIELPSNEFVADGHLHRYRISLGLVPSWRGFLRAASLVIESGPASRSEAIVAGPILVGDSPGDPIEVFTDLNLKPEIDFKSLQKLESKHGCIWWTKEREAKGFDPEKMARRALRMIEETWQVSVNLLGYRDPCLGTDPSLKKRYKINQITWYDGFWMGSNKSFPYFNVSEGGLRDEGWGNPVPHEFVHCVQGAQINFLNGSHWESHANYVRFHRNLHFINWVGIDPMPFNTLAHSNYIQDHPRLIYADYRPYFYLDSDPDHLGLDPGLTAKLWQTGKKDDYFWARLPSVLPSGVTRETIAAGIARSWITFDFVGGKTHQDAYLTTDREGAMRRYSYYTPLVTSPEQPGHWAVPLAKAPMKFGWCVHELKATDKLVQAKLEGIDIAGSGESWRWGFVALRKDGSYVNSPVFEPGIGRFEVPDEVARLCLFVAATPSDPSLPYARATPENAVGRHPDLRRYPYEIMLDGALPAGHVLALDSPKGSKHKNGGGFVATGARVDSSAYVGPDARVLDSAKVLGNARILDQAVVMGSATVQDDAIVSGGAVVMDNALVSDEARIRGFARIGNGAKVRERSRVGDFADVQMTTEISGDAVVRGMAQPLNNAKVNGHAILDADYSMDFDLSDGVHFHHVPWGGWYFDIASKLTKPRGLVASYDFHESDGQQALDEFGALHAQLLGSPAREKGKLDLNGEDQWMQLDPSLVDSPALTWIIEASVTGRGTQPLVAVNDWNRDGLMVGVSASGLLAAVLNLPGQSGVTLASPEKVVRGGDFQVALKLDGEKAVLFHNGRKADEKSWPNPPSAMFRDLIAENPTSILIGRNRSGDHMAGKLDRVRVFNVALRDDEIPQSP